MTPAVLKSEYVDQDLYVILTRNTLLLKRNLINHHNSGIKGHYTLNLANYFKITLIITTLTNHYTQIDADW